MPDCRLICREYRSGETATEVPQMTTRDANLTQLIDAADAAYQGVRTQIIDLLPPPARIDLTALDRDQRDALLELERAETELKLYRQKMYVGAR